MQGKENNDAYKTTKSKVPFVNNCTSSFSAFPFGRVESLVDQM